ncbi:HAD family hydrolase [Salinispora arenicola]|uniref:HAD family hydrolase n=1 Tax=Salinispora arenicola TaxID=168697 RepID=UPI0003717567|nr:HAD family phosphatase [Salinispora arenicola]
MEIKRLIRRGISFEQIKAVMFDCDGVLVDSETINNEIIAQLATLAGLKTSFEDSVRLYMGRATDECAAEIEEQVGSPLAFDFAARYEEQVLARQKDLEPITGVRNLLEWLTGQGLPVCVASSGTPNEIRHRLTTTDLLAYFDEHLYSASMVSRGKPAPDLFMLASERIGVRPESCLLIEDSPFGVQGGKAAGMQVVGFASLAAPTSLQEAGADLVVRTMEELYDHIAHALRIDLKD